MSDQTNSGRSDWIAIVTRLRIPLIVVSLVIVGVIIAGVAVFQVIERRNETATRAVEQLEATAQELLRDLGAAELAASAQFTDLADRLSALLEEYEGTYAEQRGLWLLASLSYEAGDYTAAGDHYTQLAARFPDSYLVAPSLASAAAAAEAEGDSAAAAELLQRIADGAPSPNQPQALFNLGRIAEQRGAPIEALGHYNRLVDEHPGSNWTNLGRNRILRLTIQGTTDAP